MDAAGEQHRHRSPFSRAHAQIALSLSVLFWTCSAADVFSQRPLAAYVPVYQQGGLLLSEFQGQSLRHGLRSCRQSHKRCESPHGRLGLRASTSVTLERSELAAAAATLPWAMSQAEGTNSENIAERKQGVRRKFDQAVAAVAATWWKQFQVKHSKLPANTLKIDYEAGMLGSGAFGWVYRAEVLEGTHAGMRVIVKRAKDGAVDYDDPNDLTEEEGAPEGMDSIELERYLNRCECESQAFHYLQVEALINDIVMEQCPEIAARYLGICRCNGLRWLVWEDVGGGSLHDLLEESEELGSLRPLAQALGLPFKDKCGASLQRLVNTIGEQLLYACTQLEKAGIAHRDMKPENILVSGGKLLLIDFGAAAAMGLPEMTGYDARLAPCDPQYAPPEEFINPELWGVYDVFSVGLCLVRILFKPMWSGEHWHQFSTALVASQHDLDLWLHRLIARDPAIEQDGLLPKWLLPLQWVLFHSSSDLLTAEQEYVDLATAGGGAEDDDGRMHLHTMQAGLEVLNVKGGGICWETLRMMLARKPKDRITAEEALGRIRSAKATAPCPECAAKRRQEQYEEGVRSGMVWEGM
mmetsp:Transcript_26669/g.63379  ORF Transcript_26669/g.63379 Transcript_26669/m.63379 type:complete len:582 (-) Transcript_26669:42-1787(-)